MIKIDTYRRRATTLADEANEFIEQGHRVRLVFRRDVPPERIIGVYEEIIGDFECRLTIRDPELVEILESAAAGAAIGAACGTAGLLMAACAGGPISLAAAGATILTSAAAGAVVGAASAFVYEASIDTRGDWTVLTIGECTDT